MYETGDVEQQQWEPVAGVHSPATGVLTTDQEGLPPPHKNNRYVSPVSACSLKYYNGGGWGGHPIIINPMRESYLISYLLRCTYNYLLLTIYEKSCEKAIC